MLLHFDIDYALIKSQHGRNFYHIFWVFNKMRNDKSWLKISILGKIVHNSKQSQS